MMSSWVLRKRHEGHHILYSKGYLPIVADVYGTDATAQLVASAPDLSAYKNYIEENLERIERGGWTPVCFDEFMMSDERETYATGGDQ
jgi:hypothetical protein